VVAKSDHNLACDNPEALARVIIDDLQGNLTHRFDTKIELYYLETSPQKSFFDVFADRLQEDESPDRKLERRLYDEIVLHPYNE